MPVTVGTPVRKEGKEKTSSVPRKRKRSQPEDEEEDEDDYFTNTIPCTHLDIVHSSQYV